MKADLPPATETMSSGVRTPPRKVLRCESICVNMYKHCGGHCIKKRGHVSPHRCGSCRFQWELSMIELAAVLSKRSQES